MLPFYKVTQTSNLTVPTVTIPLTDGGGHSAPDGFNVMELPGTVAGENTELLFPVIVTVQVRVAVWVLPVPLSFLFWMGWL